MRGFFYGNEMPVVVSDRPTRIELEPEGDFLRVEGVALFDEHTGDDGVVYDERLLETIAENNNQRIRDTGDFVPVVVLHTDDEAVNCDPPVIGMAGPFRVGVLGKEKPRHCIFGTFWIDPAKEQIFRKYPRRSVELWGEEDPEDRFFDPISLLGAETPKRDLGLLYSRSGTTQLYEMESPGPTVGGGANTYIPSGIKRRQKPEADLTEKHQRPKTMSAFSEEQISQLTEVFQPMIQAMIDESIAPGPNEDEALNQLPGEVPGEPPIGIPSEDPAAAGLPPEEGLPPEVVPSEEAPPEEAGLPPDAELDEEKKRFAQYHYDRCQKYMAGDTEGSQDIAGMSAYVSGLNEGDRSNLDNYVKTYAKDDMCKQTYMQRCGPGANGQAEDEMAEAPDRYRKEKETLETRVKTIERRDKEIVQMNRKLMEDNEKLQEENGELKTKQRYAKRRSDLLELDQKGYVMDIDEELQEAESMDDAAWNHHTKARIPQRYAKVPIDNAELTDGQPVAGDLLRVRNPVDEKPSQSEVHSKRAMDIVQRHRKSGRELSYSKVLKHLAKNDGQFSMEEFENVA